MADSKHLNVIIVGAGYAGLSAAIELARKGMTVKVYEGVSKLTNQGDVLQLASNASRVLSKWENALENIQTAAASPPFMRCQNQKGEILLDQSLPREYNGYPNLYCNRGGVQRIMYDYAVSLGVEVMFGSRISKVFDDKDGAGIYVGEERISADLVVVADGVHSKGRAYVTGTADKPQSSGFAVYRSWFPMDALRGDPLLEDIVSSETDLFRVWIGLNTHGIVVTNVKLQTVVCFFTHKDTYAVEESWAFPGKVTGMLSAVEGYDEKFRAVVKRIPENILIDYKLLWRDPIMQWVSDNGRVVLVGDAAHPHLATSGQGAAQAIEDGATLGALLDRAGKENIPSALRAFEKLRSERTSLTQRMGWELRQIWHQTDWAAVAANPAMLKMPQPEWLFGGDAEKYAYDNYDAVVSHIEKGTPFSNTNLPEGYIHQEWTIDSMLKAERQREAEVAAETAKKTHGGAAIDGHVTPSEVAAN